ncbi:mago binding protein [Cardiosporidium cionae]|uniref:Mago binding protein n=1 Tax=Cardiosporidium cionae TaxID=476202 RepID=A0ABQ7J5L0_9APIC|nr:mago binding protein [Cardiosporidium cionae]|eukprot:KAF8819289.1 mago binding protein [Cardiosporidium cionae]
MQVFLSRKMRNNRQQPLELDFSDGVSRIERSAMGETYVVGDSGEKVIKGSRRKDGSYRKDIRVKPGYIPTEEQASFKTRQQLYRETYSVHAQPTYTLHEDSDEEIPIQKTKKTRRKKKKASNAPEADIADLIVESSKLKISDEYETKASVEEVDTAKRLRNLRKKMKEITELEEKISAGLQPNEEQLQKISRKCQISTEIADLTRGAEE